MPDDTDATPQATQPEQDDSARAVSHADNAREGDTIHTGHIQGSGIAIGRGAVAHITITEERAYNVADLRTDNPYLGLRAFTEKDRDIFAGRERMVGALVDRLSADDGDRLLLIVGASGSGKSSLACAGLLPGLVNRLRGQGQEVLTHVIDHPGRLPGTTLARLFADAARPAEPSLPKFHLILVDQFEELFSQADPSERKQALSLLADHATKLESPLRIIATMRSDFLPQLLADPRFEVIEQRKVVVRAMTEDELQDAIQRPIRVRHPGKRIELALVKQLASDAASDAAYLPLLQVTLEDLWRRGSLRLGTYYGLADAIQRRANTVYTFLDYDGLQEHKREPNEQLIILDLILLLVRVSLDNEQRDGRWRRPRGELTQGDVQRERLITDLATARLLRTDREMVQEDGREREIETVDIVHEALLSGWPTLKEAIERERELLRRRVRFDLALAEWLAHERHDDYLLSSVRLAEAEALRQHDDGVFFWEDAQEFYECSAQRQSTEQENQLRLERRARYLFQSLTVVLLCITAVALYRPTRVIWLRERARGYLSIKVPGIAVRFDQYEVSNGRYRFCVDSGACLEPFSNESTYFQGQPSNDLPVTGVDALQAARFCEWIGARLPSMGEWQQVTFVRTARGTNADWQLMINTASFAEQVDHLVGIADSKSHTPEGIYNLLGNVWEWTNTAPDGTLWDRLAGTIPTHLQAVGGSITTSHPPATLEDSHSPFAATDRFDDLGFRCVYE